MKKHILSIVFALCGVIALADEGMWMTDILNKKQQKLTGAIVSYDFMGTGSLVSDQGLVVTNHHVVYGDVSALSTAENNYLEKGFWAYNRIDEIPIPGRSVQILVGTIDVTKEVNELIDKGEVKRSSMMMRRLSALIEPKYEEKFPGKMAVLSSMWKGSKYYVSLYENYKDVRLVAAPPQCIGAFGGDEDNWEWPQQKGDFSFVRIYTAPDGSPAEYSEDNVPLKSSKYLKISSKSVKAGDKTMVMGFPGRTNRYASSAQVDFQTNVTLPVSVEVKGAQMEILRKWMNSDETVRMKYSDRFFGLSNVQELYLGQLQCCKRFKVGDEKRAMEKELQQWVEKDKIRTVKWGHLMERTTAAYASIYDLERQLSYFKECLFRSTMLSPIATRCSSALRAKGDNGHEGMLRNMAKDYANMDLRVEKEIFRYCLEAYFENVSDEYLGQYQIELKKKYGKNYDGMCSYLWDSSWMTSQKKIDRILSPGYNIKDNLQKLTEDRLCRFFNDNKIVKFNSARDKILEGVSLNELNAEYAHALYQMRLDRKIKQYPDANSTLRVSTGSVKAFSPRDAVNCHWCSTVAGLLEKHNPDNHDFCLDDKWKAALEKANPAMPVNFITDNDITGGNSGSPVINSKGEIVGLAFDGNKESLASDVSFTADYNRCVCVDIRFVMWTLRHYAHMDSLLEEMGQK